jgi:hypothetical protein
MLPIPLTIRNRLYASVTLLLLAGCYPPPLADVTRMASETYPPIPIDSVRPVEPAPEGCTSVARLSARSSTPGLARVSIQRAAAAMGANRLVYSPPTGGSEVGSMIGESALALRCP